MTYSNNIADIEAVCQLLISYSFDVESYQVKAVVAGWLAEFSPVWISHAITEALYQGRYKLISIDQILRLWQRRGQPIRHFNREFESIILGQTLLYSTSYGDGPESARVHRAASPASPETTPQRVPSTSKLAPASADSGQASNRADTAQRPPTRPVLQVLAQPVNPFAQAIAVDSVGTSTADEESVVVVPSADEEPELNTAIDNLEAADSFTPDHQAEKTYPNIPNFRPIDSEGTAPIQAEVIQPFVPRRDESELHERLRAVVQGSRQA